MNLREELASIDGQIKVLEERRREIYRRSVTAPESEKICANSLANAHAEWEGKFIEYPSSISGIHFEGALVQDWRKVGSQLVRIRPCSDEFGGKTFLGLYLGDIARTVTCFRNRTSGVLGICLGGHNPAIWVPSLKRVIFGCESWWSKIESEEQLRKISDEAIDGIWYVQALKALNGNGEAECPKTI